MPRITPRPNAAQLIYGSVTVVFAALAMLLLSRTSSVLGIAVIACAALGLGLLVAMTVPLPKQAHTGAAAAVPDRPAERVPEQRAAATVPVREPAGP